MCIHPTRATCGAAMGGRAEVAVCEVECRGERLPRRVGKGRCVCADCVCDRRCVRTAGFVQMCVLSAAVKDEGVGMHARASDAGRVCVDCA